jgi:hypothetical protein
MSVPDFLSNPFSATLDKVSGARKRGQKEAHQAARDQWAVQSHDWLAGQEHGRSMEFMQAQHTNTFDMEKMRGSETRLNMRAAQKNGLNDFSQSMGADGSHSTAFSLRDASKALVEETATRPPAGQAVIPVGAPEKPAAAAPAAAAPATAAGAPAAPKAAPRAARKAPAGKALGAGIDQISARLNSDTGVQASDEKPGLVPPAHSGSATRGARQHKLI